jgi:16S rRNA (cytosine967-C5)-methyltransferase
MKRRLQSYPYADRVRSEVLDASSSAIESSPKFDLILCDVPCSGTGTLARNPEIRLRLRPEELSRQAARQRAILREALQRLAPGGRLVYSTCSLEPEENEGVVEALATEQGLHLLPIDQLIPKLAFSGLLANQSEDILIRTAVRNGVLRTLPGVHPCDGFYAVILERNN